MIGFGITTKEQAQESIEAQESMIAKRLQTLLDNPHLDNIATISADVAERRGAVDALRVVAHNEDVDFVRGTLMDAVLRGADDKWSGRRNEVARSHFDGYRETARAIIASLDAAARAAERA